MWSPCTRGMVRQGHGHIVNTASGVGLAGPPLTVVYAMTKHAVVGLSTTLRPEARVHGVRVSVLCPGSIETPILDARPPDDLPPPPPGTLTAWREFLEHFHLAPMDVDRFAEQALRGVARNRPLIVVPQNAKALWYLQRISPSAMQWVSGVMARRIIDGLPGDEAASDPVGADATR